MEELLNLAPKTRQQIHALINRIDPALLTTMRDVTPSTVPTKHQQKQLTAIIRKHHQSQLMTLLTPEERRTKKWLHTTQQVEREQELGCMHPQKT
jgi:hypothetical protein